VVKVDHDLRYNKIMKDITSLFKRLERVNTALNAIEDCWPSRQPTDAKVKPLKFSHDPQRIAAKYINLIKEHAERLAAGLPGWEVTVDVYASGGKQACCTINVFFNGSSAGRVGCQVYNMDLKSESTSFVPSLRECVRQWPGEVDRLLEKFSRYPARTFQSKRYKDLCEVRRRLNRQWHAEAGPMARYPYGKHSASWPTG
jgi:hypothetical protein